MALWVRGWEDVQHPPACTPLRRVGCNLRGVALQGKAALTTTPHPPAHHPCCLIPYGNWLSGQLFLLPLTLPLPSQALRNGHIQIKRWMDDLARPGFFLLKIWALLPVGIPSLHSGRSPGVGVRTGNGVLCCEGLRYDTEPTARGLQRAASCHPEQPPEGLVFPFLSVFLIQSPDPL